MKTLKRFFKDLKKYFFYIRISAGSALKSEVADSYLNWIWLVLDPLCMMFVYSFVFGVIFEKKEQYFPLFIFVGLTQWNFFSTCVKKSVKMVKRNRSIVSKVYLPKVILLFTEMGVNSFKMLMSLLVVFVMMAVYGVAPSFKILYIIPMILIVYLFTFGVMCICMHFGVYISDLGNVIEILMKLLFYGTGIVFDIRTRMGKHYPELATLLSKGNPMAYTIISSRDAMLYNTSPEIKWIFIWLGISLVLDVLGIFLIYKNENSYVKAI